MRLSPAIYQLDGPTRFKADQSTDNAADRINLAKTTLEELAK